MCPYDNLYEMTFQITGLRLLQILGPALVARADSSEVGCSLQKRMLV